jgi:hypothetical protein
MRVVPIVTVVSSACVEFPAWRSFFGKERSAGETMPVLFTKDIVVSPEASDYPGKDRQSFRPFQSVC